MNLKLGVIVLKVAVEFHPCILLLIILKRLIVVEIQIHKEKTFMHEEKCNAAFCLSREKDYVCVYMYVWL